MSENGPRRVVAEMRFGEDRSAIAKVGGRSIYHYWNLLAPHFRDLLLPPQRRSDDAGVSWAWREPAGAQPVAVAELARVRKRVAVAYAAFADSPRNPLLEREGTDALEAQAIVAQLGARTKTLVERFLAMSDAELSGFVCRTETGLMVHSWGLQAAAPLRYPDESESEINGTVFVGTSASGGHDVVLENANGLRMARVQSDGSGGFRFGRLKPGRYRVRVLNDAVRFPSRGTTVTVEPGSAITVELRSDTEPEDTGTVIAPSEAAPEDIAAVEAVSGAEPRRPWWRRGVVVAVVGLLVLAIAGGVVLWRPWAEKAGPAVRRSRETGMAPERFGPSKETVRERRGAVASTGGGGVSVDGTARSGSHATPPSAPAVTGAGAQGGAVTAGASSGTRVSSTIGTSATTTPGGSSPSGLGGAMQPDEAANPPGGGAVARSASKEAAAAASRALARRTASRTAEPAAGPGARADGAAESEPETDVASPAVSAAAPETLQGRKAGSGGTQGRSEIINTTNVQGGARPGEPEAVVEAPPQEAPPTVEAVVPLDGTPAAVAAGALRVREARLREPLPGGPAVLKNGSEGSVPEEQRDAASPAGVAAGATGDAAVQRAAGAVAPDTRRPVQRTEAAGGVLPPDAVANPTPPPDEPALPPGAQPRAGKPKPPGPVAGKTPLQAPGERPDAERTGTTLVRKETAAGAFPDREAANEHPSTPGEPVSRDPVAAAMVGELAGEPGSGIPDVPEAGAATVAGGTRASIPKPVRAGVRQADADLSGAPGAVGGPVVRRDPGRGLPVAGEFWFGSWQVRLARDVIVPTLPLRAGEPDSAEAQRAQILREQRALIPQSFRRPMIRCRMEIVLPAEWAGAGLRWRDSAGGVPAAAVVAGRQALYSWPLAQMPRRVTMQLVGADGAVAGAVAFDGEGRGTFRAVSQAVVQLEVGVDLAPEDTRDLAQERIAGRFAWEAAGGLVESGPPPVVKIPLEVGVEREMNLSLVDRSTGWALAARFTRRPVRGQ